MPYGFLASFPAHKKPRTGDFFINRLIWYNDDQKPVGFQQCYDCRGNEQALTWTETRGFNHARIDAGEGLAHVNATPILMRGGHFPAATVISRFAEASQTLTPELRQWVLKKLQEYTVTPEPLP
jgi:hypothetical protein